MRQAIRALEKRRLLHLSNSCDAIEELVRYAESSDDKKLPSHPAYLEARRVLTGYAESLAGQSMVTLVKSEKENQLTKPSANAVDLNPQVQVNACPISLPPPRMAKQW